MFDFLKLNKKEDKLITYLGLMRCIMTIDNEFHEQERIYVERFIINQDLDDKTRKSVANKVKDLNLDQLIERVKSLSADDQNDLLNKLIKISSLDGDIDGKEAYLIAFLANTMGMNVSNVVSYMVNNYNFNEKVLQNEIDRINNQYSQPANPFNNNTHPTPKRKVSSSNVIGYMRHSKLNSRK